MARKAIIMSVWIILLFNIQTGYSASWYVDKDATGANNGTSWYNAWTSFASLIGASSGDIVFISGGTTSKTYTAELIIPAGVTVRMGALESSQVLEHSGQIIIDRTGQVFAVKFSGNNITLDALFGNNRKLKIVGGHRGVDCSGRDGVLIRGVEITGQLSYGIYAVNVTGEIDKVYIHGGLNSYDAAITAGYTVYVAGWDRLKIHDSIIETPHLAAHRGIGSDGIQAGSGLSIYNNKFSTYDYAGYTGGQHEDAIQTGGHTHHKFYNNEINGYTNSGIYAERSDNNVLIYNNFIYNTREPIITGGRGTFYDNLRIENNTIVDCYDVMGGIIVGPRATQKLTNISIKNNIVVNCRSGIQVMAGSYTCGTDVVIDGNIHVAGKSGSTNVTCQNVPYTQPTYHSTTMPSFVSYTPQNIHGLVQNLHLSADDTIARDHGLNLFSLFTTDKDGVARPQESAWNIGAYHFLGKIPKPPSRVIFPK